MRIWVQIVVGADTNHGIFASVVRVCTNHQRVQSNKPSPFKFSITIIFYKVRLSPN